MRRLLSQQLRACSPRGTLIPDSRSHRLCFVVRFADPPLASRPIADLPVDVPRARTISLEVGRIMREYRAKLPGGFIAHCLDFDNEHDDVVLRCAPSLRPPPPSPPSLSLPVLLLLPAARRFIASPRLTGNLNSVCLCCADHTPPQQYRPARARRVLLCAIGQRSTLQLPPACAAHARGDRRRGHGAGSGLGAGGRESKAGAGK